MRQPNDKRLEALKERRAQLDAEIARVEAKSRAAERKNDTRRKILIGALVMEAMIKDEKTKSWVESLLKRGLVRDRDRILFGLEKKAPEPS